MKKICIFCSLSSFNTGMPISTYRLAAGLAGTGRYEVCAVLPDGGELAERLTRAGVGVSVIPFRRLRANPVSLLLFLAAWVRAGLRLYGFVRKNGIDIVHFSDIIDAPFYPWARFAGAKVVAHVRVCAGGFAGRFLFGLWSDLFCSRIITVSKFVKRYYKLGRRAAVVYNPGPDRKAFNPKSYQRVSKGVDGSGVVPTVITIATLRRDKGHHNFLKIASRVKERVDGKVRFIIVGGQVKGHEKYYAEIMEEARRRGLEKCLTITGNLPYENVPFVLTGAAVMVHAPEWQEALGGAVLEAMAMDVAVVACDSGGIGECFTDGKSGFLVRRGDFDGAADVVASLLRSPMLIKKVTSAAREELNAKFTPDKYVGGVEKVYGYG
jgi:glycosyltransferase involved in cell wall biosynthesis